MDRIDITIYGATGFTGTLIAKYLMGKQIDQSFTLGLAGRNLSKIRSKFPSINEQLVSFIEASNDDEQSLHNMCKRTKIVVNCVGPFDLYGRAVVKACVEESCHYMDITGEPKFFREMVQEFDEEARHKKLKICPACGYDCIPADLGTLFLLQQLPSQDDYWKNTNVETKVSVEGCVKAYIPGGPSGGSYITLINSLSSMFQRKKSSTSKSAPKQTTSITKRKRSLTGRPFYSKELKMWIVPFPTADPHIVARSAILNQYFKQGVVPFEYGNYLQLRAFWMVVVYYLFAFVFIILCQFSLGRKLLYHIGKQSGEGPTQEQMDASTFSFDLIGRATSGKGNHTIFVSVSGKDLRYGDTAKMCGESALCMLYDFIRFQDEKSSKPSPTSLVKGEEQYGVLTTAAAFGYPLIHRLNKAGIKFEMKRITFSKHETSQEATGMEKIENELSRYVYMG